MNIWLDDQREAPMGFVHVHNLDELQKLLDVASEQASFAINEMSFDFHLSHAKNGRDVMEYLADLCRKNDTRRFWPAVVKYHSDDPKGVEKMREFTKEFELSWH